MCSVTTRIKENIMTKKQFSIFNFKPFINDAIADLGFSEPTEIQEQIIPLVLDGKSAIGQSKTGTGKTHSFLLPIFEKLNPENEFVQAVILSPTRELADQIYSAAVHLNKFSGDQFFIKNYTGGTDKQRAIQKLKKQPHLIIGTPGRVQDLVNELALDVHKATILVIDEADLMLDMGFMVDVDKTASRMPKDLSMYVFSATIPEKLRPFFKKYLENPVHVNIASKVPTVKEITQLLVSRKSKSRIDTLIKILNVINPYLAIVFANTRKNAEDVAGKLGEAGFKVGKIHGDLTPRDRKKMMKQIRDLEFQFIVATDLAARGIDIEGVSHVINYEIPQDLDFYVHRVGRTARAGLSGLALTIFDNDDEVLLDKLEDRGIPLTVAEIKDNEIVETGIRNKRKSRKKTDTDTEKTVMNKVKKPKKVKPNYKKKIQWAADKLKRKERKMNRRNND
jgi:ATP-dependent RNA helicase CshB